MLIQILIIGAFFIFGAFSSMIRNIIKEYWNIKTYHVFNLTEDNIVRTSFYAYAVADGLLGQHEHIYLSSESVQEKKIRDKAVPPSVIEIDDISFLPFRFNGDTLFILSPQSLQPSDRLKLPFIIINEKSNPGSDKVLPENAEAQGYSLITNMYY